MQSHDCKRDMILIQKDQSPQFECYKCLDKSKEYTHKSELAPVLQQICARIISLDIETDKKSKFTQYSTQNTFTEDQIKEIVEEDNLNQHPMSANFRKILKTHSDEIANLKKHVTYLLQSSENLTSILTAKIEEIEEIKKQMKDMRRQVELVANPNMAFGIPLLIEFAQKQATVEILKMFNLKVELWVIEWVLRSGLLNILQGLLNSYFQGIKVKLLSTDKTEASMCQVVAIEQYSLIDGPYQPPQFIHIQYEDAVRFFLNKLPVETRSGVFSLKYPGSSGQELLVCLMNYYFNLKIRIQAWQQGMIYMTDMTINKFKSDGYLVSYNMQGLEKIYCEKSKLSIRTL